MTTRTLPRKPDAPPVDLPSRPAPSLNSVAVLVVLLGLVAASIWSIIDLKINIASIVDSVDNARSFLSRTVPLDFPPFGELLGLIGQTLAIVTCATVLSVVLSLPIALLAASNTTPGRSWRAGSRVVIVLARAVPDLILAIIFFRLFGLGAIAGILALGLHSIGMVGKLYADAIEQIDEGPPNAIRAAGGGRLQQITSGVIPQVMPQLIATALHRFDINLRTSVVLGYVGVTGIGMAIADALRTMNYQRGMALALVVLILCILIELLSGALRSALLGAGRSKDRGRLTRWADRVSQGWVSGSVPPAEPTRLSPPWTGQRVSRTAFYILTAMVILWAIWGADVDFAVFVQGLANLPQTIGLFLPPSTGGIMPTLLAELVVTVQIALAATFLGLILAIPIGVLAARNVMPNPSVHKTARLLIVLIRGIPELIIAIIFVVITGLGGVAGALALAIGSIGLLGKLVADSLEETDVRVQEAIRATGATRPQVFWSATVRQAAPSFVAHILYQLDVNIRSATLLGIVGAGGIGFYLQNAARVSQFGVVTTIILIVLAVVLIVEAIAIWARRTVK
ncbi:phosphonate ABC transporter, permease protein PhnE [Epidermidibacterium keratini]|uniref:Phosphonate ABC transporter, permease protein PhnE n=1 Tax=Epidermidibacterium keratini TaxID=1891644 RepID=A0A7L4YHL2_9ACTN|nr:phosphonate ABC transporter, permease protein PhnE [Epidermidibacterium keratini]QHB98841.1 phosphonate ABC transporter, permease protein PhnE [Epidermidibacterium keratini]